MPVRYDIAAQVPQAQSGGFDPMNAFAQMQAMSYRQQQNALAQMQMEEYARKAQIARQIQGLGNQFNVQDPRFQRRVWEMGDPDLALKLEAQARMDAAQQAAAAAQQAAAGYHTGMLNLAREKQTLETPEIKARGREAIGKAVETDIKAAQRLLAPAYMARTPDAFEAQYAQVYSDLPDSVRKRLGARPDMNAVEALMATPETIAEARKPMARKSGETITYGTGRPGVFFESEPSFVPSNRMATEQPALNTMAAQGRMPPISGEVNAPLTPEQQIIKRTMDRRTLLGQVPPEDRPKVQSQLDLAETVQAANTGLDRLAQAGGIPIAGQTNAKNWAAKARTTRAGLALGNLSDSEVAAEYNNLRTIAGIMRQRIAGAVGLTARQMDAAKEMEAFEKIVGGEPSAEGLASAKQRLNTINELLGTGETTRFESPRGRGKAGEETKPLGGPIDFGDLK